MDSLVKSKGFDPCVCVRVLSATMNWWGISILLPQLIWCLDMHLEILQASFRFDLFLCVCVCLCVWFVYPLAILLNYLNSPAPFEPSFSAFAIL